MTIYEFMLDCHKHGVRLEVEVGGLANAGKLFRRLDDYAASGAGRIVERLPGHSCVADLSVGDAEYLLAGIDEVHIGLPRTPGKGPLRRTAEALSDLPADARFEATYWEV